MLSSMPCTVLTSSARSGLPSTNTHPAVAEVFIVSRSRAQPRCTSMSARNAATLRGAFSYASRSHELPNAWMGRRSSYVLTYSRASAKEAAIFASSDARVESHVASASRTAIGPRPEFLLAGVLAGADGSAPDSEPLSPTACDEEESVCVSVSTETSVTLAAAEVSSGWNARAKATRGARLRRARRRRAPSRSPSKASFAHRARTRFDRLKRTPRKR